MIRIMMLSAVLLAVFCYAADQLAAKEYLPPLAGAYEPAAMKQYWLVLLKRGTNRTQDSAAAAKIQEAHMRNINSMAQRGALVMAGPIGPDDDLRGIFIIDAPDSATVSQMVQQDSAVITGRLRMEIYPWWTEKGVYTFK
ncbi:YciI family protein [Paracnuella aquatica]|uniref:YciI family protein n=1 Tax=Paracnuella aquatica TaxID=2268757 RepID=UPI000DEFFED6|nr:YciI family protein [Paracnuella aquatica]RPD51551.1 hypothetical protein DRJ53_02400 [Paracnuella aquatica]